ncbi:DUF2784 family protein [Pseudomonas stutzeri]|uniref:DUF2784 domain-containing protein n=1 Tax=Stutzerimonas stutzeri KOS6 TaxID=1218352 RepID=A0A061JT01_STUST|nr:DUF2784 domain-containing protein [Stutzerimonas stutzeri]EWC42832.1 hypothetical protein B597_002595 [Stutzerimonas stutzeri KOS6]MBK3866542.1 DUF2784 family protein [Stutzerimonas stutzeri]
MIYRIGADALLLLHLAFILFALLGGLFALWRLSAICVHLPAAAWAIFVEVADRGCPLTHWEQLLRARAGNAGYSEGFIEHYLLPLLYPDWLTLPVQYVLAGIVMLCNLLVYGWVWYQRRSTRCRTSP